MGTKVLESTAVRQSFSISPALDDNQIARAYLRFHDERLLPVIFSQGVPTIKAFLNLHDQKSVKFLGGFVYPQSNVGHDRICRDGMAVESSERAR